MMGLGLKQEALFVAELLQDRSKVPICTVHAVIKMGMCWCA
jgi:hypothetical protein